MGDVTEARAAMMMEQAKVLAERNALEQKIASETAKLEARMKELGQGSDAVGEGSVHNTRRKQQQLQCYRLGVGSLAKIPANQCQCLRVYTFV